MRSDRGPGALILACTLALTAACGGRQAPVPHLSTPGEIVLAEGLPPSPSPYAGGEACLPCHERIYAFWRGTAHAESMASLASSGNSGNPSCLRCHATGFGERSGYGDGGQPEGLGAVSCESCHGPAALHARGFAAASASVETGSDCPPCQVQKVCRRCHTLSRSPGFELAGYLAAVACRPAPAGEDKGAPASDLGRR